MEEHALNFTLSRTNSCPDKLVGDMFCWGNTTHGELGLGGLEEEQILIPRELRFSKATCVKQVACGYDHTLLLTSDGQLYSCGNNDHGQLGHNKPCKRLEQVDGLEAYIMTQASCGISHSLAVNEWGQVFAWGSDSHGQLGVGLDCVSQPLPKMIKALATSHVVQITSGHNHCLALTNNGELYAWGCNEYGQLGLGSSVSKETRPCLVRSLMGIPIAIIACGGNHSFAVSKSGAVYGWGKNVFGQLGLNDDINKLYPTQLKTLRSAKVKYIACGEDFSVFLTKDGGVFTCGSGTYGQLGHGSTCNEILPRKVMELMGSTVTQVTCGRRHTLALVPSRGRVYAFGLGGAGQLGTKAVLNATTPQVVLGPWVSPSGVSIIEPHEQSQHSQNCVVKRIYAGGDHCFALVTRKQDNIPSDDCRIHETDSQILSLTVEKIEECGRVLPDETVDQDLMTYVETVFSSQACINSSFLLQDDGHYCCTSRHHGVDLTVAERFFTLLSKIENQSIKRLILSSISEHLLPSLSSSPPDVETLRLYLVLPFYHEFDNPKNCQRLHSPFGQALLKLKTEAGKIVGLWWRGIPIDYFERLIRIFKDVVLYVLQFAEDVKSKKAEYEVSVHIALEILSQLNKLNQSTNDLKVPYDTFQMPELAEIVDVRSDYLHWLVEKDQTQAGRLYFCNYPFVFDAAAKTLLLETDQSLQMQSAMNQAATQVFTTMFFNPALATNISTFLQLHVSREHLVQDTLRELAKYSSSDLKKPLRVKFLGEEAEDAGGVTKEFFLLLMREILDPKYGMFRNYDETRAIWFSEDSFEDPIMYYLIGLICGLAIYNFIIIALPFPLALYKKLLNEPVSLQDLKGLSPSMAKSLQDLLDYEEPDIEDVFCLTFEITREVYGEVKNLPLKADVSNIPVTQQNKREYVDLYVDFILNKSVEKQFTAFNGGFHKVCGGRILKLFHSHELMAVIIGNENYDWEELQRNAQYKNGYTESDETIKYFWEVFHELTPEQKKKFLLYLTGSDRIPVQGMKAIKIYIQPTNDDKYLPVAHTCFNLLDLPRYKTKERLRYKLLQAIQQTEGFSIV